MAFETNFNGVFKSYSPPDSLFSHIPHRNNIVQNQTDEDTEDSKNVQIKMEN